MRGTPSRLRATALIAVAALTLHELRYAISPPAAEQAGAGHAYLPLAGVACAVILAVACARLVAVVTRARRTGTGEGSGPSFRSVWLLCAASLVAIFLVQELLEAGLAPSRPDGVAAALGAGAWVSLPLSAVLGAVVALALVCARAVVGAAARRGRRRASHPAPARFLSLPGGHLPV